ncbi:hypothetical protein CYMTET_12389 [Cymbomonas tetramitiformis]|uniref:Uncharacterized protein n=1 Tax=Cymbomonas tetramitiformis TaxID=36881 RepID=A0AAE0GKK4_9CHLO|nr:hypothetical protein CYMTET_12389 [Cymbomonas tetramitiformis]
MICKGRGTLLGSTARAAGMECTRCRDGVQTLPGCTVRAAGMECRRCRDALLALLGSECSILREGIKYEYEKEGAGAGSDEGRNQEDGTYLFGLDMVDAVVVAGVVDGVQDGVVTLIEFADVPALNAVFSFDGNGGCLANRWRAFVDQADWTRTLG